MKEVLPLFAVIVLGVLVVSFLARLVGRGARFGYRAGKAVLSPAELAFYRRLRRLVDSRALVLAKVRIADVLSVDNKTAGRKAIVALNVIAAKHTDFCVIDPETATPICCIELDDASHGSRAAKKRDALVNNAFASAGLRLLRIPMKALPSDDDLWAQIFDEPSEIDRAHGEDARPDQTLAIKPSKVVTEPLCRCGRGMVARKGKHGPFWGCPTYPKCDHTLPMH